MDQLLRKVRALDGVLELAPREGSDYPEVAWGDHFFYYAPDGVVPQRQQPYATIVTKNYPDDRSSDLDRPGRWRLNIHVGRDAYVGLIGQRPREEPDAELAYDAVDTVLPHPLYRTQGWIAIVNPGERTSALALRLLGEAHRRAAERRKSQ